MRRKISHAVFFQSTTWYITLSLQVLIEFEQKIPKGTEAQDSKITCNNILVQDWVITVSRFSSTSDFFNNYVGSNNLCTYAHFSCKNLNTGILKSIKRKCIDIFKYFNDLTWLDAILLASGLVSSSGSSVGRCPLAHDPVLTLICNELSRVSFRGCL